MRGCRVSHYVAKIGHPLLLRTTAVRDTAPGVRATSIPGIRVGDVVNRRLFATLFPLKSPEKRFLTRYLLYCNNVIIESDGGRGHRSCTFAAVFEGHRLFLLARRRLAQHT